VGRLRRAKVAGTVRSSTVVMANVLREHQTHVPLTKGQHTIGQFGSEGAEKPFGETVRPQAAWRDPDHLDAHIGEDGVEGCGEPSGPVANEDPERLCCVDG
jgi:hypothetical protein